MRRSQRLIAAAVLIALSSALAGCSSLYSWDPSDLLDFLDTKKKLPGERKPVFPDGVPGLEQGVPKELYKDNVEQQQREQQEQAAQAARPPPRRRPRCPSRSTPRNPGARAGRRPRPPMSLPQHPRRMAPPPDCRRLRSPRRSSAGAPPRRHPIRPPPSLVNPHRARSSRSNRRRHSRRRCRAVPSRADFVHSSIDLRIDSIICAYSDRKTATHFCGIRA